MLEVLNARRAGTARVLAGLFKAVTGRVAVMKVREREQPTAGMEALERAACGAARHLLTADRNMLRDQVADGARKGCWKN